MAVNGLPQLLYLSREVLQLKECVFPPMFILPAIFSSMAANVPYSPGSQGAAKNSMICCWFYKDYWEPFAEKHQATLSFMLPHVAS